MGVAGRREHFVVVALLFLAQFDIQDGHVEGAPTKVVDQDRGFLLHLLAFLVPVRQGRCGRLVDDPQHFEPGDLAGLLGGGALRVVEIRRDGDDRLRDRLAQIGFRVRLQLLQDDRRNLLGAVVLAVNGGGVAGAHLALDAADGAFRVEHRLPLGLLANQPFAGLGEMDDGRSGAAAFRVDNDCGLASLHDRDTRVSRAQVNTDCFCHKTAHSYYAMCRLGWPRRPEPAGLSRPLVAMAGLYALSVLLSTYLTSIILLPAASTQPPNAHTLPLPPPLQRRPPAGIGAI